jgi:hypothetical protein
MGQARFNAIPLEPDAEMRIPSGHKLFVSQPFRDPGVVDPRHP